MSLDEYQRKRNFDRTREPKPGKRARRGAPPIFVVQLHHATRRHYDLRLQVGDVLMSWAVPKGPSFDPAVKRMAVQTEDHPLGYEAFEGEIPKGEYGQGHMAIFDHGTWSTEGDVQAQLKKGHLRFELAGTKLKGAWHLVRSGRRDAKQPQWMLFKAKDDAWVSELEADDLLGDIPSPPAADLKRAGAGKSDKKGLSTPPAAVAPRGRPVPAAKPRAKARTRKAVDWAARAASLPGARKATRKLEPFEPQLAKLGAAPPAGDDWISELKYDGYRLVCAQVAGGEVGVWSRNALPWAHKVPELVTAIGQLGVRSVALDGELIAGRGTQMDFTLLQGTLSAGRTGELVLATFDLLHLDGYDLGACALRDRKALLADLLASPPPRLAYSSHIEGSARDAFETASRAGFEGIISKRADAPYRHGRSDDWRKTKVEASDEFAVVGWSQGKGRRSTGIGSLLLAAPEAGGWRYVGKVGSGFSNDLLLELGRKIGKRGSSTPTARIDEATLKEVGQAVWFEPMMVVEVFVRGRGSTGILRQPSLKAIREDKSVDDLRDSDRAASAAAPRTRRAAPAKPATAAPAPAAPRAVRAATPRASVSSPDKVVFADMGYTKADVLAYYESVMEHLLPGIVERPLSLIRCPNGAGAKCFFQKHHTPGLTRVDLVPIREDSGASRDYLVVRDAAGVLELVQFNGLEFHPWGSTAAAPECANRIVFDLDPAPDVPFAEVKASAVHLRRLLADLELESFLRTTGGKGLHVVVPLNPGCDWEIGKRFAKGFATALAGSEPQRYIAKATIRDRAGRIFVDYLRNGRGATAVASYSLRARPGAPVAMPIAWSELAKLEAGDAFTLANVPAKLRRRRKDPWADIERIEQNLARWAVD